MKYRKKPVEIEAIEIEAIQFVGIPPDGTNKDDIIDWVGNRGSIDWGIDSETDEIYLFISTLEGTMQANVGDWVIRGVQGEFYPCKPDIFEATYDPVREGNSEPIDLSKTDEFAIEEARHAAVNEGLLS